MAFENLEDENGGAYDGAPERPVNILNPRLKSCIFIAVIWILMNIAGALYISLNRSIYFWDNATYWDISRSIASGAVKLTPALVYKSVAELDYNYIAGIPSAIWSLVFGSSRMAYISGLINMYMMPAVVMIYILSCKIAKAKKTAAAAVILILPATVFITFIGFADIGGITPCLICIYLYLTDERKSRFLPVRYIIIGLLLVFVMLWRRWYAFFSVSFITAMIADTLILRKKLLPPLITVFTSGAVLMLFFRDFVFGKLLADYGNLYSGYKFSLSTDIKLITRYFGILTLAAAAAGSAAAFIKRHEKRTVFLWTQMLVCFIMFTSTQTHGQQHLLLYVPSLCTLLLILISYIDRLWLIGAMTALCLLNTVNPLIPRTQPDNIQEIKHYAFIPDFSMLPVKRADVDEIIRIKYMLDAVIEEDKTLGVLASSFTLNEDILKNAEYSMGQSKARVDYIVPLPQVDSRDKDVRALYNVNYMLVAFPAQTHLAPGSQTVVTEAVKSFEAYADFACAYDEMTKYRTSLNGMELRLYKRNRMVSEADMITFEKRLNEMSAN